MKVRTVFQLQISADGELSLCNTFWQLDLAGAESYLPAPGGAVWQLSRQRAQKLELAAGIPQRMRLFPHLKRLWDKALKIRTVSIAPEHLASTRVYCTSQAAKFILLQDMLAKGEQRKLVLLQTRTYLLAARTTLRLGLLGYVCYRAEQAGEFSVGLGTNGIAVTAYKYLNSLSPRWEPRLSAENRVWITLSSKRS